MKIDWQFPQKTIWLAPLAGITDASFRGLCRSFGADVLISEMVSADGIVHSPKAFRNTLPTAEFSESERPFGIQLFGSDPRILTQAIDKLAFLQPDFFDLNMGCPVRKVVNRNAGSGLLRDLPLAKEMIVAHAETCQKHGIPATIKIRSGWDQEHFVFMELGYWAQQHRISAVIFHPRTRSQMFSGHSDWNQITMLKQALTIPVIGNGDIFSPFDAQQMFEQTHCDAIMLARGAFRKPWLFRSIRQHDYLPTVADVLALMKAHLSVACNAEEEKHAVIKMRKFFANYSKGFLHGAQLRANLFTCHTQEEVLYCLTNYANELHSEELQRSLEFV